MLMALVKHGALLGGVAGYSEVEERPWRASLMSWATSQ